MIFFWKILHIFDKEQDERIEISTNLGKLENMFNPLQEEAVIIADADKRI